MQMLSRRLGCLAGRLCVNQPTSQVNSTPHPPRSRSSVTPIAASSARAISSPHVASAGSRRPHDTHCVRVRDLKDRPKRRGHPGSVHGTGLDGWPPRLPTWSAGCPRTLESA